MKTTQQTAKQSVLQHGLSVYSHTYSLLHRTHSSPFRLPQWWDEYEEELCKHLHPLKAIKHYTVWHDVGKPLCRMQDERGTHFPNHAAVSSQTWMDHAPAGPDKETVGRLIANDMAFHTMSVEAILALGLSDSDLATLLVVSLAELHSNAAMFGGIESDGFKGKWKKWSKTAHKICQTRFNHAYMYVLVRKDLSHRQQAVQSAHACIEAARHFLLPGEPHPSVILCTVKSEQKLKMCADELSQKGLDIQMFYEPDIGMQATALACRPLRGTARKAFQRFQLMQ